MTEAVLSLLGHLIQVGGFGFLLWIGAEIVAYELRVQTVDCPDCDGEGIAGPCEDGLLGCSGCTECGGCCGTGRIEFVDDGSDRAYERGVADELGVL